MHAFDTKSQKGVTLITKKLVHPGQESRFTKLILKSEKIYDKYPGYEGLEVFTDQKTSYLLMVYKFDTDQNLEFWLNSKDKLSFTTRMDQLSSDKGFEKLSGAEYLFQAADQTSVKAPPKYKMVLASVITIFPLQALIITPAVEIFTQNFKNVPSLVVTFLALIFSVSILTYVLMPEVTTLLKDWLNSD